MKKLLALSLALLMLAVFATGCGKQETNTPAAPDAAAPAPAAGPEAAAQPETEAPPEAPASKVVYADPSYDDWDADKLYEAAKAEGGTIIVYADTSKISKVCDAFAADYPDVKVEYYNIKANEILEKVPTEASTGNVTADVLMLSDGAGILYNEFYDEGYVQAYMPTDIVSHIDPALLTNGLSTYTGLNLWFYNTAMYPNGAPIDNLWQIVEKDASGKQGFALLCKDIAGEPSYLSFYSMMVARSDDVAAAYKNLTGMDLEYTYDATKVPVPENNAGYEYLYRLAQCDLTFIDDGDEIMKGIAEATAPTLGIASGNKLEGRDENGWPLAWIVKMDPFAATQNANFTYLISQTDNPAGARLLIYCMLGGKNADTGAMKPFTRQGQWFTRDDVEDTKNEYTIAEIDAIVQDKTAIYNTYLDVNDFWIYWYDQFH